MSCLGCPAESFPARLRLAARGELLDSTKPEPATPSIRRSNEAMAEAIFRYDHEEFTTRITQEGMHDDVVIEAAVCRAAGSYSFRVVTP